MIYRLLTYLVFGLGLPFWLLMRRLRGGFRRRLGLYGDLAAVDPWPPGPSPRIWFHGASAGDVRALRPVIRKVRAALPRATLFVSVVTDTGHAVATAELSTVLDGVTYAPIDLPGATRRTMRALQPDVLVLEYAELWPNLLAAAELFGAKRVLGNGRLSPRRMTAYRWLGWLSGAPWVRLDRLLMRSPEDARTARLLGAPKARIEITGNTKLDDLGEEDPRAHAVLEALGPGPWLVAGSTHADDETAVLPTFAALRRIDPSARLLLAPRYPERAAKVAETVARWRWTVACAALDQSVDREADVVVVSAVGRLRAAYGAGRLAVVGGSFGGRGGHNVLEPAVVGCPVVTGPDLGNFSDAVELLRGHGLIQVRDAPTLARVVVDLWTNEALLRRLASEAKTRVLASAGASQRNADVIIELAGRQPLLDSPS
ncbi:MAG: glycosyltransferase N-terminal domain-containing protein [Myxococcota bacterium]